MSTYKVISSDSHIIEPADLWEKRLDPKFKDRGPRLIHEEEGDQWYCDNVAFGNIGINSQAGLRFEDPAQLSRATSMDAVPLGGLDPHEHVKDMEKDGVSGGLLYPSQGLSLWRRIAASDMLSAVFRAYNEYVGEFCQPYPKLLKGIAMVNVDDVDDGVKELERSAKMGLAGAMISVRPRLPYHHNAYERLWAAAQDLDMPLSLHTATIRWVPGSDIAGLEQDVFFFPNRDFDPRQCVNSMIFSGVFERYPKLKIGVVEFEVAWAPFFMERMDSFYMERAAGVHGQRFKNNMLPSDFFRNNVFIGFQEDDLGIQLREHIGVDNLLWGSDYPHAESTFPKSREIIEQIMADVPEDEKAKIVGENTARLYHFD